MNASFQFQCPNGHLLEGQAEQAGQQCTCPICGILFIIPQPLQYPSGAPGTFSPGPTNTSPAGPGPAIGPSTGGFPGVIPNAPQGPAASGMPAGPDQSQPTSQAPAFPNVHEPGHPAPGPPGVSPQPETAPAESEPEFVHIPCPNGHELETPLDMIGQEVLCPECNAQFTLRRKDSVEYQRQKQFEQQRRDERIGNLWFNWAIIFAVAVVIGLIIMVIASS